MTWGSIGFTAGAMSAPAGRTALARNRGQSSRLRRQPSTIQCEWSVLLWYRLDQVAALVSRWTDGDKLVERTCRTVGNDSRG